MPNRRHYRGPRRPAAGGPEGSAPEGGPQPERAFGSPSGSGAEEGRQAFGSAGAEGRPQGRRRHRGRGGRGGPSPDLGDEQRDGTQEPNLEAGAEPRATGYRREPGGSPSSADAASFGRSQGPGEPTQAGDEARRRRRRRSRGRGRDGQPVGPGPETDTPEGERPADYIPLQVERGTAFLFEPRETALEVVPAEEETLRPQRSKRVNSGKLFWYIRSKSYVPIPELRRRFEITPDEMGTIQDNGQKVYIGLPQDVADVVSNLRRQQKIGLECSADFSTPVVIGVYPLSRF